MSRYIPISEQKPPMQKRTILSLFCVLMLFYLGFHTVSGERGLFALVRESHKLEQINSELAVVIAKRKALDGKVRGLSSNSLDLDLLDEQSRRVLGILGKNEVVLFTDGYSH